MSKIDKLQIRGVRSFDNNAVESIQFFAPLTLIVGHNGSGKTTIIECLKYATTGDLPPNSKGGAFIHDPKLCGEKEVLAQVKLAFTATSGAKMVATRSLQLTVKKAVRSQKTLEGQLLMAKDGERIAVSSRVAELDKILPQYLGVSKAVLDNVIFCHQDESLWPMSEPSLLKKKFDEIFEALKYTKAIDNIKVIRKKQTEELAKFRIIEQHAKEDKDKGDRAEKRSHVLGKELDELREKIADLSGQIKEMTIKGDTAWTKRNEFFNKVNELKLKRGEERSIQINVERLEQNLEIMHDSEEALQAMLDQYEERAALYESDLQLQKEQYSDLKRELDLNREALGRKREELGLHRAEKAHYEAQLRDRETLVKEIARRYNIRGFDHELSEERVRDFMERMSKLVREQKASGDRARAEVDQETREAQINLNDLNQRKIALSQSRENAKSQITANDKKIANHQMLFDRINVDEGARATLETRLEDTHGRLTKVKGDLETAKFNEQINEKESKLRDFDNSKEHLQIELAQIHRHAADTARVDFLRKSLKESRTGLETMKGAHGARIAKFLGRQWSVGNLETDFKAVLDLKGADVHEIEQQRNGTSRELEQFEFKLDTLRKELHGKKTDAQKCKDELSTVLEEGEEYLDALKNLENNRDRLKKEHDSLSGLGKYYIECQEIFKAGDLCRLCQRTFKFDKDRKAFSEKMEKMVSLAAEATFATEIEQHDEQLRELRQMRSSYEILQRLSTTDIPKLERELQQLEPTREVLISQMEQQDRDLDERLSAKRDVESLTQTVQNITKYFNDIKLFESQVEELSVKQSQKGLAQSAEAIEEEQKKVNDQSRAASKALSSLLDARERVKEQIQSLEIEVRDVRAELNAVDNKLLEKSNIGVQIESLLADNKDFRSKLAQMDDELRELVPQITQSQAKLDDIKHRGDERQRALNEQTLKLSASLNQLNVAEKDVNSYLDRNGAQKLTRAERELEQLQGEGKRIELDQTQLAAANNKLKAQQTSHWATKTSIQNNLTYRQDTRSLAAVRAKISTLDSYNAEEDCRKWESEANKLSIDRGVLDGIRSGLMGEMKSKDDQLMQLLTDWNTDYKDAAYKYKESNIKVEATKHAIEDLGRYGDALNKAIMKYHSLKMEEINRIVEELWKRTYQGTDVDTILIRSDNENVKGNKSYNYRVCMVKQDAEMDMRGRCSAGQKVLASIIIRLALAECFGTNCGLIALDEPTTNLDRDNIRALAASLHDIIKARRGQSNFQLIVITHDEEFLRNMQCADFCDHYYRVSRNEKQKSGIDRQSIADVME